MLCAYDPLQHDLGTDVGTDTMNDLWPWKPLKILVFSLYRTDGTDDILLKLKKKKSIYKKYYKRTVQRCVLSVLSVPFRRWEQMWTMICDSENPCEHWTFSNLPQIPQMLYYLNLKYKKIYKKKVILRENSKNICGICGNYWKALILQRFCCHRCVKWCVLSLEKGASLCNAAYNAL